MPPGFAGHAKATDRVVRRRAAALAADLADVRADQRDGFLAAAGLDDITKAGPKKKRPNDPDEPLSGDAVDAVRSAIDELDTTAYVDVLSDATSALVHAAYRSAAELLDLGSGWDVAPTWALDYVQEAADHVGSLLDERDRAALTQVLDDALTTGLSARDTAFALRVAFDTVRAVDDDGTVRETRADAWFSTVARTELQDAAVKGQHSLYQAAGVTKVRIQGASPCEQVCAQYDGQVFPIDEVPEGGPTWHPCCCCIEVPADDDLGDWRGTDEDRAAARRGNEPDDE